MPFLLVLRWAARDLRRKWLQVGAIAVVIAIGTGAYAALGGTAQWRRQSNDASYERTAMYDLRVRAAEGSDAGRGAMLATLQKLPDPGVVSVAEERIIAVTQVDASTAGKTILVPGRIIGVDVSGGGPHVNEVIVDPKHGRSLQTADDGAAVVVLERNFAHYYRLPPAGDMRLAGNRPVQYVGAGMQPEYFYVTTEDGAFFAEANFAAVFTSLSTAESLTGRAGRVNDLVMRLRPGADVKAVKAQVTDAFSGSGLAVTVMERRDEPSYRVLYDDIEGDQKFWNIFAALILLGAAVGAFNLVSRMVEAQRREIGIGMAMGMSRRQLAARPLLVAVLIAVLGVVFGAGMGFAVIAAIRPVYTSVLPMPVWITNLQLGMFLRGAAVGFALPVVAAAWPVWRAMRVMPVEAITTAHRTARGGLSPVLRRLRWPRGVFARMPLGNVLRTPRRTVLTVIGVGASVTALIATLGMVDSFVRAMDRNEHEVLGAHPDRMVVALQGTVPVAAPEIEAVRDDPTVAAVEPVLRVGGRLGPGSGRPAIDVMVEVLDLDNDVWAPSIERGSLGPNRAGVVIAREAANDLHVGPGDMVELQHPALGAAGYEMVTTPLRVAAVHPSPFRFGVFVDRSQLAALRLPAAANQLYVLPATGRTPAAVQRALFGRPGVASVQPVAASATIVSDSLDQFVGVFRALEAFVLLLALLMAYNATSINADERARDHATLFAFGLPRRRVVWMEIREGTIVGLLATMVAVVAGFAVMRWFLRTVADTMPELGIDAVMSFGTLVVAFVLGMVAVAVAPLFTLRRLRRMDVPGTLRVVE